MAGNGDPVVLVPGLLGSGFGYRTLAAQLNTAGYKTIIVEPLGVGRSARPKRADYSLSAQADRLAAVFDSLKVRDAFVVAHAVGASIAFRLAYKRPDLARGLISLDGGPAESATTPGFRRAMRLAPIIKLLGAGLIRHQIHRFLIGASADTSWVSPEVVDGYSAGAAANLGATIDAYRAMADSREPEALEPHLGDIRIPVLLLVGRVPHDGAIQPEEVDLLAERLPAFTLDTIPDVGHFPHEEAPEVVVLAIDRMRATMLYLGEFFRRERD
jgi:pimeloyl-ACP methyl ester carboxylesterase